MKLIRKNSNNLFKKKIIEYEKNIFVNNQLILFVFI